MRKLNQHIGHPHDSNTVEPGNSKLFEKQQKVYYCQEFTIEEVIYVINRLKSSQKKFTIDPLFTIDQFTIARFDCICSPLLAICGKRSFISVHVNKLVYYPYAQWIFSAFLRHLCKAEASSYSFSVP